MSKTTRTLLWFGLLAVLMAWFGRDGQAQTQPSGAQLRVEASAPTTVPLTVPFLALIDGRLYRVEPGAGLAIQPQGGRLVLISTATAPVIREKEEYPPRLTAPMGTFTLAEIPAASAVVNVYRNGLRLKPGEYSVAGKIITFAVVGSGSIPQAGDDLAFVYRW